tara:strand:+ start:1100 stop:1795 length:696 start_codon:yes stop_codon:yes gene_type:complete
MERVKIFIGYDPKEAIAFHTLVQSIMNKATIPFDIVPLDIKNLPMYTRKVDAKQSNEFSFTRFLVPYLSSYKGISIYLDCDMMLRTDIADLITEIGTKPIYVVKHDYKPKNKNKYLGARQYNYPRKNWSSVIVWNCSHASNLIVTPDLVNNSKPNYLHQLQFVKDEEIGELDVRWNWLVGEYSNTPEDVKNVHWTLGGPYFEKYKDVEFANEWTAMLKKVIITAPKVNYDI